MAQASDTLLMRTIRLVNGLVGKSSLKISTGWEIRPDNLQSNKQFFYVEIFNPGPFSCCVADVSLRWQNPERSKTVKSIIVGEEKNYPVIVKAGVRWRIHLLPSLINLNELSSVYVELSNGQKLKVPVDPAVLASIPAEGAQKKWAGGLRLQ